MSEYLERFKKYISEEGPKLDPVGKEDDDIDNDGDVDSSDKFLHKKRKAISKAIKKRKNGDVEEDFWYEKADQSVRSSGRDNVHDLSPAQDSENHNTSLCGWNNAVCPDEKLAMATDTRGPDQKELEALLNKYGIQGFAKLVKRLKK